jgi:hypothetical protein
VVAQKVAQLLVAVAEVHLRFLLLQLLVAVVAEQTLLRV